MLQQQPPQITNLHTKSKNSKSLIQFCLIRFLLSLHCLFALLSFPTKTALCGARGGNGNIKIQKKRNTIRETNLVGGLNPFEKYYSKWESSPNRGENKRYLKPPSSNSSPMKIGHPKRKFIFHPLIFTGLMLVSGRVTVQELKPLQRLLH